MKMKTMSLIALSVSVCSIAFAAEFKSPEFNEDFKVEGAVKTDRGIASEKEPSEREPSSIVAADKKPVEEEKAQDEKFEPKPWMYKNKLDSAY